MWLQNHICFGKRYSLVRMDAWGRPLPPHCFGTFPILRPIFHKMKMLVVLYSKSARGRQEGQQNTNRLAQSLNEQLIYRVANKNFSK